jgi:hypothetical protein
MDRVAVKRQSRAVIESRRKPVLTASLLFLILILIFSVLSYKLTAPKTDDVSRFIELYSSGDYAAAEKLWDRMQPPLLETLVSDLLSYLQAVVLFGFMMLMLKAIHGEEVVSGMLLDGFGSWVKVLLLELLLGLIYMLCLLLLIFPFFWALYSYRMARYLLLTHPEFGVIDCLRESRLRTAGHRMDFFTLDLSFLGWVLLCAVPVIGLVAAVWLLPYWQGADLLYCEAVNARFEPAQPPEGTALP